MASSPIPRPRPEEEDIETNSGQQFVHKELRDPSTYIRLIRIHEALEGEHLICSLRMWHIEHAPPYQAISYTWGEETLQKQIKINGSWLTVRKNCDYALRQAFGQRNRKYGWLWVDSICIDQNNLNEKSKQVRLMGRLYSKADRVLSCVGAHADDSKFLINTLRMYRHLFVLPPQNEHGDLRWTARQRLRLRIWMLTFSNADLRRLFEALQSVVRRPYFSRVWIVQEVSLAKEGILCCGPNSVGIHTLIAFSGLQQDCRLDPDMRFGNLSLAYAQAMFFPMLCMSNVPFLRRFCTFKPWWTLHKTLCFQAIGGPLHWLPMSTLIKEFSLLNCTDGRDKIYAILEIAGDAELELLVPDYSITTLELAHQVMEGHKFWNEVQADQLAGVLIDCFGLGPHDLLACATFVATNVTRIELTWHGVQIPQAIRSIMFVDQVRTNECLKNSSGVFICPDSSQKPASGNYEPPEILCERPVHGTTPGLESVWNPSVSRVVETGDWILVRNVITSASLWQVGIIVRPGYVNEYTYVGPVLIKYSNGSLSNNHEFRVSGISGGKLLDEKILTRELDKLKFSNISDAQAGHVLERAARHYESVSVQRVA